MRRVLDVALGEFGVGNTAATAGGGHALGLSSIEGGLRELVDSGVVIRVVLLSIRGNVPLLLRDVRGGGPSAVALDGDDVGTTADAEETLLTPVGAPRVSYQPVWTTILFAISDD